MTCFGRTSFSSPSALRGAVYFTLKIGATADYPEIKATYVHLEFSGIQP
jgi:hypothetical protein